MTFALIYAMFSNIKMDASHQIFLFVAIFGAFAESGWEIEEDFQYSNSFSQNPKFNIQVIQWLKSTTLSKKVLPIIKKQFFENEILTGEKRYYLDRLYSQMERNLG